MNAIHYIGLDVHKKTISYCIKMAADQIVKEGTLAAGGKPGQTESVSGIDRQSAKRPRARTQEFRIIRL